MEEASVEDLPKLIFVEWEYESSCSWTWNYGIKSVINSGELATYRCSFCGKCYKRELFYKKHVEYCEIDR